MKTKFTLLLFTSLATIFLTSCSLFPLSPEKQANATLNAFSTVFAEMTTQAFLYPEITETPQSTSTNISSLTPTASETTTQVPTSTFTPSPTSPTLKAELLYVTTFPEYKTEFTPNEKFGVAIGFLNTGSVTWGAGSKLLLVGYDGEYVTVQTEAILETPVAPGKKVEFNIWAFGSEDMSYQSNYFQLYSEFGVPIDGGYAVFSYQPI